VHQRNDRHGDDHPTLQSDFNKHLLYVNVHTAQNPMGEIRRQLRRP
jgi:CHRD domain-containing protein